MKVYENLPKMIILNHFLLEKVVKQCHIAKKNK